MFDLDTHLGLHTQALALRARRAELLAANLANADTPNYKARDIDFRRALGSAASDATILPIRATQIRHLHSPAVSGAGAGATPLYRVPSAPALDGNTVDVQVEQAAFAENAVRYQATLTFLNSRLRSLLTAITGQ
ncbi:MAG: flagellar basal body rod protein FlgB [Steroidobacteraceae bacterium]|nr:flagellar basal body rod protein FlgB [Steroidobacteraceae bacterium]MDW8259208.1 flagellar basal body rod protein FlgB [Gammaproteobacteria bacterium]